MAVYEVTIRRTIERTINVNAESRSEAELKALEHFEKMNNMKDDVPHQTIATVISSCEADM